ncbi:MAG: LPS export ABC transporter ATP-binding protein [Puniceicoccales bacterium]|jgi:lipopolysaccharide export system ATP-binding protein|nr:LPS export ABC transporter ATP-binding protein [Puniceicoccales bacterium]
MLQTVSIAKNYGGRSVVCGIDLLVQEGEIVGLLGPNGAGKTTTFYMIVGLVSVTSGSILLDEKEISKLPVHSRARLGVGYLPQEPSVFGKLTVADNIRIVMEFTSVKRNEIDDRLFCLLKDFGIAQLAKQKAYTLSGGERRRLEIARALVTKPRFLLLDEPFSGVDPISVTEVQDIILALKKRGVGVLITDHNVRETLAIVDRAYLVYDGKVLCEGERDKLLTDADSRRLYLGENFKM